MARKTTTRNAVAKVATGATSLVPIRQAGGSIAKLPGVDPARVTREDKAVLVVDTPYVAGDVIVPASEVYFTRLLDDAPDGPWLGEADKVAWRDSATGYECIMLRQTRGGFLSGYVGVPASHPLHGFERAAVPPEVVDVHGGLAYSRACDAGPAPERRSILREARRICDTDRVVDWRPTSHATDYRVADRHAWWFGFDCDRLYDVIPDDKRADRRHLGAETGAVYRDDAYVVREILHLAAQLKAVADGVDPPTRIGPTPPPMGLDPRSGA